MTLRGLTAAALSLALPACLNLQAFRYTKIQCTAAGDCASGESCVGGQCVSADSTGGGTGGATAGNTSGGSTGGTSGGGIDDADLVITQPYGPVAGGETVTITGALFGDSPSVKLGTAICGGATVVDNTKIVCISGANAAGTYDVTVTTSDQQTLILPGGYTYYTPSVSTVALAFGPIAGGQTITVAGTDFKVGPSVTVATVDVGPYPCGDVTVTADGSLTCVTSAATVPGTYDVSVTTNDNQQVGLTSAFTYLGPPVVSSISPPTLPATAGGVITFTGTNFQSAPGLTAKLNGAACTTTTYVSASSLTCAVPPGSCGPFSVSVTNADGQSGTLSNAFTYDGGCLSFEIGTTSPTPPATDDYGGAVNTDVTHTYTVKNTGSGTSGEFTFSLSGPDAATWSLPGTTGATYCTSTTTLPSHVVCLVDVTFSGGEDGTTLGAHSATLNVAENIAGGGGQASNAMTGTTSYSWAYIGQYVPGTCSPRGATEDYYVQATCFEDCTNCTCDYSELNNSYLADCTGSPFTSSVGTDFGCQSSQPGGCYVSACGQTTDHCQ